MGNDDGGQLFSLRSIGLGSADLENDPTTISIDGIEVDQQCNINVWTTLEGARYHLLDGRNVTLGELGAAARDAPLISSEMEQALRGDLGRCDGEPHFSGDCIEVMNRPEITVLNDLVPGGLFPSGTTPEQYCASICSQSCYGGGGLAMWTSGPCIQDHSVEDVPVAYVSLPSPHGMRAHTCSTECCAG